jgi:dipeptidyl aminopeptidase/acylaminoacyl peptidase
MRAFLSIRMIPVMLFAAFSAQGAAAAQEPIVAPFGSWRSPITAQMLVEKSVRFYDVSLDGETLYWSESRPEEQGRYAICRRTPDGVVDDVLPPPFSARTLANEYGGGAFLASNGVVYFSSYADQRVWRVVLGKAPEPLTAEGKRRFADFVHDAARNRLIAVCEDHSFDDHEPANRVVAISLVDGAVTTLVEGADFYSSPRLSPDGRQLAWLAWNHPNMPWDSTELFVATIGNDGTLAKSRKVAGGEDESIAQPAWSPDGTLYFVSDRTNWWNLYADRAGQIAAIAPMKAEFAPPQWVFGVAAYGFASNGEIIASYTRDGSWRLARIDPATGKFGDLGLPITDVFNLAVGGMEAFAVVSFADRPDALVHIDLATGEFTKLRSSSPVVPDPAYTSIPVPIEFPTEGGKTAHAFYYPSVNRDYRGPAGEAPPLLVMIHGGPTAATAPRFRLATQYWTSRGFAVCDVNYGGSTGYGREYRNRLRDGWGVVDVADAANAAKYLAEQGKADPNKLLIRGGSAGGYTTLACLAFTEVFRAGASHYGISDLALMVRDTHKFESRYLDRLVGRYPEDEAIYRARSPIFHLDKFNEPVILLQGLEDKVVPPNQAELVLESLRKRGVPVAYVPFAGEQHGFRRGENIIRAQEAELYFYSRVLSFPLADEIEPVEIFNLPPQ